MPRKMEGAKRHDGHSMYPEDLVIIGVDTPPDESDELYDRERVEAPLNPLTTKNILKFGVIHPIVVTRRGDKYVIVSGVRRGLHARAANQEIVSASQGELFGRQKIMVDVVLRDAEKYDIEGIKISENEHREMAGPLARIRRAKSYLDNGHSKAEAAVAFGVTEKTISNWLAILSLDQAVIDKVARGDIGITAALRLSSVPQESQAKVAEDLRQEAEIEGRDKGPTTEAAKAKAQQARGEREEGGRAPGKKMIKRVIDELASGEIVFASQTIEVADLMVWLRWTIGEAEKDKVKYLPKIMNKLATKPAKRGRK